LIINATCQPHLLFVLPAGIYDRVKNVRINILSHPLNFVDGRRRTRWIGNVVSPNAFKTGQLYRGTFEMRRMCIYTRRRGRLWDGAEQSEMIRDLFVNATNGTFRREGFNRKNEPWPFESSAYWNNNENQRGGSVNRETTKCMVVISGIGPTHK